MSDLISNLMVDFLMRSLICFHSFRLYIDVSLQHVPYTEKAIIGIPTPNPSHIYIFFHVIMYMLITMSVNMLTKISE